MDIYIQADIFHVNIHVSIEDHTDIHSNIHSENVKTKMIHSTYIQIYIQRYIHVSSSKVLQTIDSNIHSTNILDERSSECIFECISV